MTVHSSKSKSGGNSIASSILLSNRNLASPQIMLPAFTTVYYSILIVFGKIDSISSSINPLCDCCWIMTTSLIFQYQWTRVRHTTMYKRCWNLKMFVLASSSCLNKHQGKIYTAICTLKLHDHDLCPTQSQKAVMKTLRKKIYSSTILWHNVLGQKELLYGMREIKVSMTLDFFFIVCGHSSLVRQETNFLPRY